MLIVYLHGFASSPQSSKAQFFLQKFTERAISVEIPRLDQGDFEHLTVSSQLKVVDQTVAGRNVVLMGSSLGGYLAALYAARHPNVERLILLAPAFQFPTRFRARYSQQELDGWKQRGSVPVFHYGYKEERALGFGLVEDSAGYEDEPDFRQPALIFHGVQDPVVPASASEKFVVEHPNTALQLLQSGHELTDVLDRMWLETVRFLDIEPVRL